MVGIYHGRVLRFGARSGFAKNGCSVFPVTEPFMSWTVKLEWTAERYESEGKVGGFFNSSRKLPAPHGTSNH
jgi:hypothetical protein